MSKRQKFFAYLSKKPTPSDVAFCDLESFCSGIGFNVSNRNGGSHYIFRYEDFVISVPNHGIVKQEYLRRIVQAIQEHDLSIEE